MQTLKQILLRIWIWFKTVLTFESPSDLLFLALHRLANQELIDLVIALVKEAARTDLTGPEKKRYVMDRLHNVGSQLEQNIYLVGLETLSTLVNTTVEYLQLRRELPHPQTQENLDAK